MIESTSSFCWTSSFELSLQLSQHLLRAGGKKLEVGDYCSHQHSQPTVFIYDTPDVLLFPDSLLDCEASETGATDLASIYRFANSRQVKDCLHLRASQLLRIEAVSLGDMLQHNENSKTLLGQPEFTPISPCPLRAALTLLHLIQSSNCLEQMIEYERFLSSRSSNLAKQQDYLGMIKSLSPHYLIHRELLALTSRTLPYAIEDRAAKQLTKDSNNFAESHIEYLLDRNNDLRTYALHHVQFEVDMVNRNRLLQEKLAWNRSQVTNNRELASGYRDLVGRLLRVIKRLT